MQEERRGGGEGKELMVDKVATFGNVSLDFDNTAAYITVSVLC